METHQYKNNTAEGINSGYSNIANPCDCDSECRKRGTRNLVILTACFIALFIIGYLINPGILRIIWLILSGSLAAISALLIYLINTRVLDCSNFNNKTS